MTDSKKFNLKNIQYKRASDLLKDNQANYEIDNKSKITKKIKTNKQIHIPEKFLDIKELEQLEKSKKNLSKKNEENKQILKEKIINIQNDISNLDKNHKKNILEIDKKIKKIKTKNKQISKISKNNVVSKFFDLQKFLLPTNSLNDKAKEFVYQNIFPQYSTLLQKHVIDYAVYCKEIGFTELGIELLCELEKYEKRNHEIYEFLAKLTFLNLNKNPSSASQVQELLKQRIELLEIEKNKKSDKKNSNTKNPDTQEIEIILKEAKRDLKLVS